MTARSQGKQWQNALSLMPVHATAIINHQEKPRKGNYICQLSFFISIFAAINSLINHFSNSFFSMKKYSTLLLLVLLAGIINTHAGTISEKQAQAIASKFMATRTSVSTTPRIAAHGPQLKAAGSQASYYVFNASSNNGYVIVAGDDRAPAVLGYSDKGSFNSQDVPEAMQELLDSYAEQINALASGAKVEANPEPRPAIAPMVQALWSQNNPFNILLPFRPDGKHAAAGCVATAMAQLMYYHKWPARPTRTIPSYTSTSLGYYMPALPPVDFKWDDMKFTYLSTDTTSAAALAVATLTLYCAQSVEMDFKETSSGATTTRVPWKLSTYFDYKPTAHSIWRMNYSSEEWADAIYSELSAGRPLIFSGKKKSGGHAFICDGYDGNGMFHFNWGWNGQSNGFFLLNVVNPDDQGTGSASGTYGYILDQAALVGIEPGHDGSNEIILTASDLVLNSATTSRSSTNRDFSANVTGIFRNLTGDMIAARYGWGLYDANGSLIKSLHTTYTSGVRPGNYYTLSDKTLDFGSGLTSGTYRIMPFCKEYIEGSSVNDGEWILCAGADKNYIEVTINGNRCEITGHGSAATRDYTINDITYSGSMHHGRPVDINVNMTNNSDASANILYLFADGTFVAAAQVGLNQGETGDINFKYVPATAGNHQLTWSWNDNGSSPIATRTITIEAMPAATLSGTMDVYNITDVANRIITSDKFSVDVIVSNDGDERYHDDISISMYKNTYDNYGTRVQNFNFMVDLAPGESTTLHVDMDQVFDNWRFFVRAFYYSEGTQQTLCSSGFYTIAFPEEPEFTLGDVNGDSYVTVADVTMLISLVLNNDYDPSILGRADMNSDGSLTVSDVTRLISQVLSGN